MLILFLTAKKGKKPFSRESIAGKSTFISFSRYFIAMRTVVIPYEDGRHSYEDGHKSDEDGRHGDKAPNISLGYLELSPSPFANIRFSES